MGGRSREVGGGRERGEVLVAWFEVGVMTAMCKAATGSGMRREAGGGSFEQRSFGNGNGRQELEGEGWSE